MRYHHKRKLLGERVPVCLFVLPQNRLSYRVAYVTSNVDLCAMCSDETRYFNIIEAKIYSIQYPLTRYLRQTRKKKIQSQMFLIHILNANHSSITIMLNNILFIIYQTIFTLIIINLLKNFMLIHITG